MTIRCGNIALRVIVNVATAPISGRNPAMKNALSKLPVICTTYPVTIGAARPNELPPITVVLVTLPISLRLQDHRVPHLQGRTVPTL